MDELLPSNREVRHFAEDGVMFFTKFAGNTRVSRPVSTTIFICIWPVSIGWHSKTWLFGVCRCPGKLKVFSRLSINGHFVRPEDTFYSLFSNRRLVSFLLGSHLLLRELKDNLRLVVLRINPLPVRVNVEHTRTNGRLIWVKVLDSESIFYFFLSLVTKKSRQGIFVPNRSNFEPYLWRAATTLQPILLLSETRYVSIRIRQLRWLHYTP